MEGIKYIACLHLLEEMCNKEIIQKDPDNPNNILIYRTGIDEKVYGVSEGWFTQNIFDTAQELFSNKNNFDSLKQVLAEDGFVPKFTADGEFKSLSRLSNPRDAKMTKD